MIGFVLGNDWNVGAEHFGALPLLVGTLITSALALLIGVPVAVATALYATELCPPRLRAPLTMLVELLAAVPSVVYGLWGIFFLAPKLQPAEQWVADRLSFIPFIGGGLVTIPNYFITGLVLAIMILPIVSAISREVMATVPARPQGGGARARRHALGDDPHRGAAVLPLGHRRRLDARARPRDRRDDRRDDPDRQRAAARRASVLQGYSLAAAIANEFGEAQGLHRSALFAAGLVLFVLTLLVNGVARLLVLRASRASHSGPATPPAAARRGRGDGGGRMSAHGASPERLGRFAVSPARRRKDRIARTGLLLGTLLALVPLVLIVYYLLRKGLGAWSPSFFTTDPTGNTFFGTASIGGIKSAILGTIEIVALASAISIPLGVGVAIWLVEYGRASWFAQAVRFFVDVLTGVPSILFGLFVYIVLIIGTGSTLRRLQGLDRARAADAADRDSLGRGDPAARPLGAA